MKEWLMKVLISHNTMFIIGGQAPSVRQRGFGGSGCSGHIRTD